MGKADATEVVKKGKPNLRDELQAVDMGGVRRINIQ